MRSNRFCPTPAVLLATVTVAPLLLWVHPAGSSLRGTMARLLKELLGAVLAFTGLATLLQVRLGGQPKIFCGLFP